MMRSNANTIRGSVTINPATFAVNTTADTTVTFNGAEIGDKPVVNVVSGLSASACVVPGPPATTTGVISIRIANLGTTTVAGGTVVCSITLIKNDGEDNVP
jgi:hypothetical protein